MVKGFRLMGIALPHKTSNKDGQSMRDCGSLWERFQREQIREFIHAREDDTVYAVYHHYSSDHEGDFAFFIGCRVAGSTDVPAGLEDLKIPGGTYYRSVARGKMPDCIIGQWQEIWQADIERSFQYDFEVYDERSADDQAAEVDIFLSKS